MAPDIRVTPTPDEARRLALAHNVVPVSHSFICDCETPVSAFLKLGAPTRSFLLESAEQGQRQGRYSFLGVGARALVTYADGVLGAGEHGAGWHRENGSAANAIEVAHDDPFAAVADLVSSYRVPEGLGLPPLAGGAVGYFGYDLVRRLEHLPDAPPDDLDVPEMAFLLADTVLVFDHLQHRATIVANAFLDGHDVDEAYERAVERIAQVREALRRPLPETYDAQAAAALDDLFGGVEETPEAAAPTLQRFVTSTFEKERLLRRRRPHPRLHLRRRRLPGRALAALPDAGRRAAVRDLPRPAHASTRRRTCTSSPSTTSPSAARRPSRW